jgi:hypothetical protein
MYPEHPSALNKNGYQNKMRKIQKLKQTGTVVKRITNTTIKVSPPATEYSPL